MRVAVARRMMRPGHRVNGPGRGRTSGEYQRDLTDWARLCSRCHGRHDREIRGAMRRRFPDYADKGMMERRAQRARGRQ